MTRSELLSATNYEEKERILAIGRHTSSIVSSLHHPGTRNESRNRLDAQSELHSSGVKRMRNLPCPIISSVARETHDVTFVSEGVDGSEVASSSVHF